MPVLPSRKQHHLREYSFKVVVVSNQGGISLKADAKAPKAHLTKLASFKSKVLAVMGQLDIPISIYAATGKDIYRKPRTGMWTEILKDYGIGPDDVDYDKSIFVGDAGGRAAFNGQPKDFSCSDRCVPRVSRCLHHTYMNQKLCSQHRHQVLHPGRVFSRRSTTSFH